MQPDSQQICCLHSESLAAVCCFHINCGRTPPGSCCALIAFHSRHELRVMSLKRLGLVTLKPNYILFTQQTKYHNRIKKINKRPCYKEEACFLISESSDSIVCTLLNTPALSVTLLPELLNKTSMRSLPFHSTSQPLPPHPLFGRDGLY